MGARGAQAAPRSFCGRRELPRKLGIVFSWRGLALMILSISSSAAHVPNTLNPGSMALRHHVRARPALGFARSDWPAASTHGVGRSWRKLFASVQVAEA